MAVIELLDGPLKGTIHEVQKGWPVPGSLGLDEDDFVHWYTTSADKCTAKFDKSEKKREALVEEVKELKRCLAELKGGCRNMETVDFYPKTFRIPKQDNPAFGNSECLMIVAEENSKHAVVLHIVPDPVEAVTSIAKFWKHRLAVSYCENWQGEIR